jgi:vesicle coat complex subunit
MRLLTLIFLARHYSELNRKLLERDLRDFATMFFGEESDVCPYGLLSVRG